MRWKTTPGCFRVHLPARTLIVICELLGQVAQRLGQEMSKCECVRKREVSNYFKWKFKDTSINYHSEASVKSN